MSRPRDFVDLRALVGLTFEIGYATDTNFTGAVLPGYAVAGAWLHVSAAEALERVLSALRHDGEGLVVYDAYRPARASAEMARWCEANGQEALLDGWVGRTSRHNRGIAIDVGLISLDGRTLPMGGSWDAFDPASFAENAVGEARDNRARLSAAMQEQGFSPYWREWWHFERPVDPLPPALDVPYG